MRRRISILILSLALLLVLPLTVFSVVGDKATVNIHKNGETITGTVFCEIYDGNYYLGDIIADYGYPDIVPSTDEYETVDFPAYTGNSETIEEEDTPLTGSFKNIEIAKPTEKWALVNLIITLIILLISGAFFFVRQKKHEDDDNEGAYKEDKKDLRFFKILGLFIAIVTILVFLFTEDLSLPMQLIDKWTIIMLLFFIDQIFVAFVVKRSARGCDKDEEWVNH